jgi:hypothetical protein
MHSGRNSFEVNLRAVNASTAAEGGERRSLIPQRWSDTGGTNSGASGVWGILPSDSRNLCTQEP